MPTLHIGSLRVRQGDFVLRVEDWRASSGQVVLLAGPNGSGKTTFQEAAFGVRRAEVRRVEWGGEPQAALRSTAAYVPTDLGFFPSCRPRHMAAFFRALYPSWSEEGFGRRVEEWKIPMDRPFKTLSMGQKRRFYLALGLATGASVLVLDEPLANVDPDMAYALAEDLQRLAREENLLVWISTNVLEPFWGRFDQADFLRQGELARRIPALEAESSTPRALWREIYS